MTLKIVHFEFCFKNLFSLEVQLDSYLDGAYKNIFISKFGTIPITLWHGEVYLLFKAAVISIFELIHVRNIILQVAIEVNRQG